jgi:hypothetical protein
MFSSCYATLPVIFKEEKVKFPTIKQKYQEDREENTKN